MKRKQGPDITPPSQAKKTKEGLGHNRDTELSAVVSLQKLLDFSQVKTEDDIEYRLNHIAKTLLHEFHLVITVKHDSEDTKETEFKILEAEFYLQTGWHQDPFTHGSEEQKISGKWYFHRAPRKSVDSHRSLTSLTGYRGGSRKGMDLTIGGIPPPIFSKHFPPSSDPPEPESEDQQQLLLGGILLRSLRQLEPNGTSKIISGPSLLVDHIISLSGASGMADLVENKWLGDTCAFTSGKDERSTTMLFLRPVSSSSTLSSSLPPSKIYFSSRIGLDLSHPGTTSPTTLPLHPRIQFLPKPYRFFTHPEELVINGRPQTFLGVLYSCISNSTNSSLTEALKKPRLSREIAALMSLKEPTSAKYLAEYVAGHEGGVNLLGSFVGPRGKGASSSPSSYLRMMGAFSNLVTP